ncbi:hypothetical protein [Pseudomonas benzenivorans]|uniref:MSHA biogenesis protein MshK n=1 Tax=Pseudomonas benzenivorans TaxID=556533 RepID=A0ABY5H4B6_9PSED|nr:hypothetical protein [Pseudomonas benzenivorans]UTW07138.1 hypothetical protein KDW96_18515 [Pseudomonas benzenivorans]
MSRYSLVLLAMTFGILAVAGESRAEVTTDPFSRPTLSQAASQAVSLEAGAGLELRGILLAGEHSVVNVGGTIVALGEAIDGYLLTQVSEEAAVFRKNNESIRIRLKGHGEE